MGSGADNYIEIEFSLETVDKYARREEGPRQYTAIFILLQEGLIQEEVNHHHRNRPQSLWSAVRTGVGRPKFLKT